MFSPPSPHEQLDFAQQHYFNEDTPSQQSHEQTSTVSSQEQSLTPYDLQHNELPWQLPYLPHPPTNPHWNFTQNTASIDSMSNAVEPTFLFDTFTPNSFVPQNLDTQATTAQNDQNAIRATSVAPPRFTSATPPASRSLRISGRGTSSSPISIPDSPESSPMRSAITLPALPMSKLPKASKSKPKSSQVGLDIEGVLVLKIKSGEKEVKKRVTSEEALKYNLVKKTACETCRASKTKCEFGERKDVCMYVLSPGTRD